MWAGERITAAVGWWDAIEVNLDELPSQLPGRVTVVDATGTPYATFYSENRVPVDDLQDVAPALIDAVLAVEDDGFYEHGPIDFRGTARALVRNQTTGTTQGGSTITQQYVKNLRVVGADTDAEALEATETSLYRKIVELKWAAALEQVKTKDEILLGYLNVAYFGNGAYGIGAAAQFYFGVPAADLTVAQSALLAGLLKNPTGYDPLTRPAEAQGRRSTALARMVAAERLSQAEADNADAEPLGVSAHPLPNGCTQSPYPFYCDWVKATLLDDEAFGEDAETRERNLYEGGFTVRTALDPSAMASAQNAVNAALSPDNQAAAAIAVVEPGTGRVLAIAQTRTYQQTQFNYPVQALVQPGSTFKPITLAAGLEAGFAPDGTLASGTPYSPAGMNAPAGGFGNVDGQGRGTIDAATAMKYSVNTWFVRLVERTGTAAVADMAYRLGMRSMNPATRSVGPADASITLGAFETTPLDLANVYATIAADGVRCRPLPITGVTALDGTDLPTPDPQCEQAVEPSVVSTVASAMTATFTDGGTAEGLDLGRPAVGKTGTTNEYGATWFAGFVPQRATAVWVGDPRGPSYPLVGVTAYGQYFPRLYGSTVAGPIWRQAMAELVGPLPVEPLTVPGPLTASGREVPDVTGLTIEAAVGALQRAGYDAELAGTGPGRDQPIDTVVSQVPAGGSRVPTGQVVDLTLVEGSDLSRLVQDVR